MMDQVFRQARQFCRAKRCFRREGLASVFSPCSPLAGGAHFLAWEASPNSLSPERHCRLVKDAAYHRCRSAPVSGAESSIHPPTKKEPSASRFLAFLWPGRPHSVPASGLTKRQWPQRLEACTTAPLPENLLCALCGRRGTEPPQRRCAPWLPRNTTSGRLPSISPPCRSPGT